jgi:hypothetical protein
MIENLISRLDFCKPSGSGRWIAKCPAHKDNSPSLAITTNTKDGRILIHCFAGCGATEVLDALDMDYQDLFPPSDGFYHARGFRRSDGPTVDSLMVDICANHRQKGRKLSKEDKSKELAAWLRTRSKRQ